MGGTSSSRRYVSHPGMEYGYPAAPGTIVEELGFMQPSVYGPPPPGMVMPVMPQEIYQQEEYGGGGMRRYSSDPNLIAAAYDPYAEGPMEGYDPNMVPYEAYNGYEGYPVYPPAGFEAPERGRWGSMPVLNQPEVVQLARMPRNRPLLQKIFGPNSVAQRKRVLQRLDSQQQDPLSKTAEWLMKTDDNPPPPPEQDQKRHRRDKRSRHHQHRRR